MLSVRVTAKSADCRTFSYLPLFLWKFPRGWCQSDSAKTLKPQIILLSFSLMIFFVPFIKILSAVWSKVSYENNLKYTKHFQVHHCFAFINREVPTLLSMCVWWSHLCSLRCVCVDLSFTFTSCYPPCVEASLEARPIQAKHLEAT